MQDPAPDVAELEARLSIPSDEDVALMGRLEGDLLILGAGGKMGPTLARLAVNAAARAGSRTSITAVARFTDPRTRAKLDAWGVRTTRADLLCRTDIKALPDAPNVIFMAGQKFGTSANPGQTWAANAYMPALVAERFAHSRIVAFSSGNVYPFSDVNGSGSAESGPVGPLGEYAQSVLARERLFGYFSASSGTPIAIMRLNYAVEPRYGVLRDIADTLLARKPVDLRMGYVNVIWQRDANSIAMRLLEKCASPPFVLNVTGARCLSVRMLAERMGRALGVEPTFHASEKPTALLSDASVCMSLFGVPETGMDEMIDSVARWVGRGGAGLGKPTHFEERGGSF